MTLPLARPRGGVPHARPRGAAIIDRWAERVRAASRFVRFSALGATVAMPLTGAVTAGRPLEGRTMVGVTALGVTYHCFGFVLNDVCDLEIDRTEPRRARSPLVQGRIARSTAVAFALANIPASFAVLWWLEASATAFLALGLSIALGVVYDVYGKRCPWPPVTDLVQAGAWAALAWTGAELAGGPTAVTVLLMAFFAVYIVMTNGVHGSLRDLANDRQHGARTTAIAFGAAPLATGGAVVPDRLRWYALALQTAMIALSGALLVALGYAGTAALLVALAWVGLSVLCVVLLVAALRQVEDRSASMVRGTQHLIVALGVVIVLLAPRMPWALRLLAVGSYVGPLLTYGWLLAGFRRRPARVPV